MNKYNFYISLIGRSNVGKSSLFNKLVKYDYSLVSKNINSTLDRKYSDFIINKNIKIIDTGSPVDVEKSCLYKKVFYQTSIAIKESNLILFIIDGSIGFTYNDEKIFNLVKKKDYLFIIVNKIDILNKNLEKINLFNKDNIFYISTIYNTGIDFLIKNIIKIYNLSKISEKNFINKYITNSEEIIEYPKLYVIGRQNVGKSTLINSLLKDDRLIVSDLPGTTINDISISYKINNINFILYDTAGFTNIKFLNRKKLSKKEKEFINKIKNVNIIIFIIDITNGLTKQEIIFINFLIKNGKSIILLFNKCDLLNKENIKIQKSIILKKISFAKFLDIYFISALLKKNLCILNKLIKNIYFNINKEIKINYLNKILKEALLLKKPISKNNIKPKLKFCNFLSKNPIKIIIFGINTTYIHNNYKKYLINFFSKKLNYKNISINIFFKNYEK